MQAWLLIDEVTLLIHQQRLKMNERHNVIVNLVAKRTLLGKRYYQPITQKLMAHFPSCSLMITEDGRIGRHSMAHSIGDQKYTDKKGHAIGGWMLIADIGQMSLHELEQLNKALSKLLQTA